MNKFIWFLILSIFFPIYSFADSNKPESIIEAKVTNIHDGDTFTVEMYLLPGLVKYAQVRLLGIDTPELNGKCQKEIDLANKARKYLITIIKENNDKIFLNGIQNDKYGNRFDANVFLNTNPSSFINNKLIYEGLAVEYWGGTKTKDWCK